MEEQPLFFILGRKYENWGDKEMAKYYYKQAIDEYGDISAMNNLATLLDNEGDLEQSEHYYLRAIEEKDCAVSMFNLATTYMKQKRYEEMYFFFNNVLIKADAGESFTCIERYDNDNPEEDFMQIARDSAFLLADYFLHIEENLDEANHYFHLGADKYNCRRCMCSLGNLCKKREDIDSMIDYYTRSAEMGYKKAAFYLGVYYRNSEQHSEALKYLYIAIDLGYEKAYASLAIAYGEIGEYDLAIKYYKEAVEHGSDYCNEYIQEIEEQLNK